MLQFIRCLAPIQLAVAVHLNIQSKEELSKPEMRELMELFVDKIQGLHIDEFNYGPRPNVTLSQFYNHFSNCMKNLVNISIHHEMKGQVGT